MKFLKLNMTFILTAALALGGSASKAEAASIGQFMKGCLIMGGLGIGGTYIALSQSKATSNDPAALASVGVINCLIGGLISSDVETKAEQDASGELMLQNMRLKNSIYSVHHDLCVLKGTCGPDGFAPENKDQEVENAQMLEPKSEKNGGMKKLNTGN